MISLSWVKDYVDLKGVDLKELAVKITQAGVNIEKVVTNHIDNLVVGEILDCSKHPDSDHLNVCKVNVGDKVNQIVCGASNVRKGLKVIVALPGAVLPGNVEIKQSVIRKVESNGMICALFELGLEEKTQENYDRGIEELDSNAIIGSDPMEYLGLDDTLYELDVHKHRNNDCYYHIGFAYEIATILNKKVTLPVDNYTKVPGKMNFDLKVDTDKCTYYKGKIVKDVKIKESPEFIKKRLNSVGMRSINNVVDISNYVMLEYGQPLHFFDLDTLGDKVLVRNAFENEKIVTLDNKERVLLPTDIVITDTVKPVCLAGVMGGLNSEITNDTKNIFIESAIFNPISIRNTSSRLNLKSEASTRYGKGLSYEYTDLALERACYLLEKYADGKVIDDTVLYDNEDKTIKTVSFTKDQVNKLLGITISEEDMEHELDRLDFKYVLKDSLFTVTIPKRRLDIDPNVNDIAEEIGRLYGYHNLKSTLPVGEYRMGEYIGNTKYRKLISKRLRSLGLNESKNYTLVSEAMSKLFNYDNKEQLVLPNPLSSDKTTIRTSLLPSLLNVFEYNKARKVEDILVYEIANTYDVNYTEEAKIAILMKGNYITNVWNHNSIKVDFYLIKGIVENILDYMGLKNRYSFEVSKVNELHPGISASILLDRKQIGIIGRIHPSINKEDIYVAELSLNELIKPIKAIKYKPSSKYPEIKKDLAFVVDKDTNSDVLLTQIKKSGGRLLTDVEVFDVYTGTNVGDNEKSIAFNLTFSNSDRTLEEKEVMDLFNKIISDVETKLKAKLRG